MIMMINSETIFSMTQANQNFSRVAHTAERTGEAVIFKNNKPKYILLDIEKNALVLDLSEEERFDIVTGRTVTPADTVIELAK